MVCLRVPGGSCPVAVQVRAVPVPRFDRVGGLHLRPRPHTESAPKQVFINKQTKAFLSVMNPVYPNGTLNVVDVSLVVFSFKMDLFTQQSNSSRNCFERVLKLQ